jgi:hypothetical protein
MKYKIIILTLLGNLIFNSSVFSQPRTTIQFVGGYSIPMGDMKGKFDDNRLIFNKNADSNTYYLQNGFNFGLIIKNSPFRKFPDFRITGGIAYNYFSQNKDYSNASFQPFILNYNLRFFTISLGGEYAFMNKRSKINPFAGAEFTANFYSSTYQQTFDSTSTVAVRTFNSTTRFGVQFNGGVDIVLGQRAGLVIGAKYNMANLIGKNSQGDNTSTYSLNDKAAVINGVQYYTRNTFYLQLYLGLSVYLGI